MKMFFYSLHPHFKMQLIENVIKIISNNFRVCYFPFTCPFTDSLLIYTTSIVRNVKNFSVSFPPGTNFTMLTCHCIIPFSVAIIELQRAVFSACISFKQARTQLVKAANKILVQRCYKIENFIILFQ